MKIINISAARSDERNDTATVDRVTLAVAEAIFTDTEWTLKSDKKLSHDKFLFGCQYARGIF